jgi:ATP-dependent helicase HepA
LLESGSKPPRAVIEVLPPLAGRVRYRVFHSPGEIGEYSEEQLSLSHSEQATPSDSGALSSKAFLGSDEFLARLTACPLANPLTDNLYALHAARSNSSRSSLSHCFDSCAPTSLAR